MEEDGKRRKEEGRKRKEDKKKVMEGEKRRHEERFDLMRKREKQMEVEMILCLGEPSKAKPNRAKPFFHKWK